MQRRATTRPSSLGPRLHAAGNVDLGPQPRPPAERDDRRPVHRGRARARPRAALGLLRLLGAAHRHRPRGRGRCSRRCAADGIKVGVLSNTIWPRAWHRGFFERDGVLDLIDGDVYTSEIPWTKPSPAGVRGRDGGGRGRPTRARCVYVGDRLFDDVWGAQQRRAAGDPHPAQQHPAPSRSGTPRASPTPWCTASPRSPSVVCRLVTPAPRAAGFFTVLCNVCAVHKHEDAKRYRWSVRRVA